MSTTWTGLLVDAVAAAGGTLEQRAVGAGAVVAVLAGDVVLIVGRALRLQVADDALDLAVGDQGAVDAGDAVAGIR